MLGVRTRNQSTLKFILQIEFAHPPHTHRPTNTMPLNKLQALIGNCNNTHTILVKRNPNSQINLPVGKRQECGTLSFDHYNVCTVIHRSKQVTSSHLPSLALRCRSVDTPSLSYPRYWNPSIFDPSDHRVIPRREIVRTQRDLTRRFPLTPLGSHFVVRLPVVFTTNSP